MPASEEIRTVYHKCSKVYTVVVGHSFYGGPSKKRRANI